MWMELLSENSVLLMKRVATELLNLRTHLIQVKGLIHQIEHRIRIQDNR